MQTMIGICILKTQLLVLLLLLLVHVVAVFLLGNNHMDFHLDVNSVFFGIALKSCLGSK